MTAAPNHTFADAPVEAVPLGSTINWTALATVFWLTLRQFSRGKRLIVVAFLFLLPSLVAILIRSFAQGDPNPGLEIGVVLMFLPHIVLTLTAMLYATGMILDELEDQTLTYLLVRPISKWGLFLAKLSATVVVTICLTAVFTVITYGAIYFRAENLQYSELIARLGKTILLESLALCAYCSLFALIGVITRRALLACVAYSLILEGVLANFDFVLRKLTVMYHFRVLALRWLPPVDEVKTTEHPLTYLETAQQVFQIYLVPPHLSGMEPPPPPPAGLTSFLILLVGSVLCTAIAALIFSRREYRVKTPEGN